MGTAGAYEAKTHLARLLDRGVDGETLYISLQCSRLDVLGLDRSCERRLHGRLGSIGIHRRTRQLGGTTLAFAAQRSSRTTVSSIERWLETLRNENALAQAKIAQAHHCCAK